MSRGNPPELAGFDYQQPIGEGGFADVFLYRQQRPNRPVAVKVLIEAAMSPASIELFNAEADVMAQLADHQSIVPIFAADIAPDGRPYLVMQYCPGPHRAHEYRRSPLSVSEALDMMVKVSGAVETAHRAGVLHRDIKPPNILTSSHGEPMLTDFGIAGSTGETTTWSGGMSVPWAPPEAFGDNPPADVRSDVFSLAATTYSLLAGRSPFEVPGAANDNATLMTRIERQAPACLTRPDVTDELNDLLARAMSRRIEDRPASAVAFADALQTIQQHSSVQPTVVDVLDARGPAAADLAAADHTRTRIRPVSIIVPDALSTSGTRPKPAIIAPRFEPAPLGPLSRDFLDFEAPTTGRRARKAVDRGVQPAVMELGGPQHPDERRAPEVPKRRRIGLLIGGGALALVLAVVAGVAFLAPGDRPETQRQARVDRDPGTALDESNGRSVVPPLPEDLRGTQSGSTASFTWTEDAVEDTYAWGYLDANAQQGPAESDQVGGPPVTVDVKPEGTCIWLRPVRDGATPTNPVTACAR